MLSLEEPWNSLCDTSPRPRGILDILEPLVSLSSTQFPYEEFVLDRLGRVGLPYYGK